MTNCRRRALCSRLPRTMVTNHTSRAIKGRNPFTRERKQISERERGGGGTLILAIGFPDRTTRDLIVRNNGNYCGRLVGCRRTSFPSPERVRFHSLFPGPTLLLAAGTSRCNALTTVNGYVMV